VNNRRPSTLSLFKQDPVTNGRQGRPLARRMSKMPGGYSRHFTGFSGDAVGRSLLFHDPGRNTSITGIQMLLKKRTPT
jgi:hypothetical protein